MSDSSFREVLKNPHFLLLWTAQIFSQFSDKILFLFMVDLITKDQFSNSAISGLTLVFTIPAVIFGSVAGVFVDRWNKKLIMVISNIFRAIFVSLMLFSHNLFYIYTMAFLVSTLTQFFAPAETSMIPSIIDKKNLMPANSLFTGTMLSSVVLGFAIGAPIISKFNNATGIVIAVMYLISTILVAFIKINQAQEKEEKSKDPFIKEFKEGLEYVFKKQIILFSLIRLIIMFSAFAALSVLIIGFVKQVLNLPPVYFGYLLASSGLGMGLGAAFTGKFGNNIGKEKLIFRGFLLSGISLVILANTELFSNFLNLKETNFSIIFAFIFASIVGFTASLSVIPLQTILQEITEEKMRGKVFGVQNMFVNTAMTVPMAFAGLAADFMDDRLFHLKGVSLVMTIVGILVFMGSFFKGKKYDLKS